jgi:O-antigen/teichoic acid export membrane protein
MFLRRSLSRNTLILLVGNTVGMGLAFAFSALLGRATGQTGLGVYAAVLAWVFPLTLLAEFGVNTLITRDLALDLTRTADYLAASAALRWRLGGGVMIGIWLLAPLMSDNPQGVMGLRLAAPLVLIEPTFGAYSAVFRARQTMRPIVWLNVGMLLCQIVLCAGAFALGYGVLAALAINTLTSLGRMLAARWWITPSPMYVCADEAGLVPTGYNGGVGTTQRGVRVLRLLRRAVPFALAGVLAALHLRAGFILLEALHGSAALGLLAAAWRFIEAARLFPHAFFDALLPTLSAEGTSARVLGRAYAVLIGYSVAAALGFALFGRWLIVWVYGAEFAASSLLLTLGGITLLPSLLRSLATLQAYARQREGAANIGLGIMIVLWGGALPFIAQYGAVGVIVAGGVIDLIGYGVIVVATSLQGHRL